LSKENEPHIYNAIRHGAICENVILDPKTLEYDFNNDTLVENSRVSYPIGIIYQIMLNQVLDLILKP